MFDANSVYSLQTSLWILMIAARAFRMDSNRHGSCRGGREGKEEEAKYVPHKPPQLLAVTGGGKGQPFFTFTCDCSLQCLLYVLRAPFVHLILLTSNKWEMLLLQSPLYHYNSHLSSRERLKCSCFPNVNTTTNWGNIRDYNSWSLGGPDKQEANKSLTFHLFSQGPASVCQSDFSLWVCVV